MHEELVRLSNVWQADVATDRARARLAALAKGVEHATRGHHDAEAARRDARAERDALEQRHAEARAVREGRGRLGGDRAGASVSRQIAAFFREIPRAHDCVRERFGVVLRRNA